jgi:hypothetical protein
VASVDSLRYEFGKCVLLRQVSHGDKGAETVHRNRPLILNSVAVLDVLLLAFLKQVGACGHANSHDNPFSSVRNEVETPG